MSLFDHSNHEIFLITAHHDGRDGGFIATWFFPATLIAGCPRVVGIFSPQNITFDLIQKTHHFVAHLLSSEQVEFVPLFGLQSGREINKFANLNITRTKKNIPLIPNTCGWMECKIVDQLESGDRSIVLADVMEQHKESGRSPLRKSDLAEKLPEKILKALHQKRIDDGIRDKKLLKQF